MHKCDGCKYKSEHQEMGFMSVGVCTKELLLPDAIKAYTEPECRFGVKPRTSYNIPKKAEIITELCKHTEMKDAFNEYAAVLKKAAQGALNAYTTNLSFGGKPDQHEEDWIEALFCGMQSISLVEELQKQLERVEMERDAAVASLKDLSFCYDCKHWDAPNNAYTQVCKECKKHGMKKPNWEWVGGQ